MREAEEKQLFNTWIFVPIFAFFLVSVKLVLVVCLLLGPGAEV